MKNIFVLALFVLLFSGCAQREPQGRGAASTETGVVTGGNGKPIDANADEIPDYLSDPNGNGLVDSGEIGWNIMGDLGLKVLITEPKPKANIP